MIQSKKELNEYIEADRRRYIYNPHPLWFRLLILGDEEAKAIFFLTILRHLEYYINTTGKQYGGIKGLIFWYVYRRLRFRYKIYIEPNRVGPGLRIFHFAGGVYLNIDGMGMHCSVSSGVVCGNKNNDNNLRPIIGDNVDLCVGSKLIGKIKVGNNVIIGPNSVVVKDVKDNTVMSGIPAIPIKKI